MGKKKTPSRYGHYCWACDRHLPNERFSGRNHPRHLCRECAKLGREELAYRQGLRDIDRLTRWGAVKRKDRTAWQRFLEHENPEIRRYAQQVQADLDRKQDDWRRCLEEDLGALDIPFEERGPDANSSGNSAERGDETGEEWDADEIPF